MKNKIESQAKTKEQEKLKYEELSRDFKDISL